ncbi:MAG: aryl-sulfate sulfotransferase [Chloroflexota bacterium]
MKKRKTISSAASASALLLAFGAGIVLNYTWPDLTQPLAEGAYSLFIGPARRVRDFVQTATSPHFDPAAMNEDRFGITNANPSSDLTGAITFAMRGTQAGYQDRVVTVDRQGQVVAEHRLPEGLYLIGEVRRLPNGHFLFLASDQRPQEVLNSPSANKWLFEVDTSGTVFRKSLVPATHHAEILANGNLLLVDASRDQVTETNPAGADVWVWRASDHVRPYMSESFIGITPTDIDRRTIANMYSEFGEGPTHLDWTHVNSAQRLANGNTLISLRNFDLVAEVNHDGEIVRTIGALIIKHQHCPWMLENGNVLITDNGNARVIEMDPKTQTIVWQYSDGLLMPQQGCAYRLPSGNTLITDTGHLRVIEVTSDKRVVWELRVQTPATVPLYRAVWSP